jgi:hypothetical protein
VTRVTDEVQDDADWKGRALVRLFSRDFPYWAFTKLFERQFLGIMGADAEVVRALSSEQRRWVARLIESMRPVSLRTPGVLVDHHQPLPGEAISGIRTPTLIVHAEDDGLHWKAVEEVEGPPGRGLACPGQGGSLKAMR